MSKIPRTSELKAIDQDCLKVRSIRNCKLNEFDFRSFNIANGKFNLHNTEFVKTFLMKDGNLGVTHFNEVNFLNAKICLDSTYLGECIFSNIIWPAKYKVFFAGEIYNEVIDKKRKNLVLREVYRQLKNVNKNQTNNIEALGFYRNEMKAYSDYLDVSIGLIWDKIILKTSYWSNNFGQNGFVP